MSSIESPATSCGQLDDVDADGADGPDVVRLAPADRAVRRIERLLDRVRERSDAAVGLVLVDDQRPVGVTERDEVHLVAAQVRRIRGVDRVPLARPRHAAEPGMPSPGSPSNPGGVARKPPAVEPMRALPTRLN